MWRCRAIAFSILTALLFRGQTAVVLAVTATVLLKGGFLFHPNYFYNDVRQNDRYVGALRSYEGSIMEKSRKAQVDLGVGYPRIVAGKKYAFPYSPVFYLPFTQLPPDRDLVVRAIKHVALFSTAVEVALAFVLARMLSSIRGHGRGLVHVRVPHPHQPDAVRDVVDARGSCPRSARGGRRGPCPGKTEGSEGLGSALRRDPGDVPDLRVEPVQHQRVPPHSGPARGRGPLARGRPVAGRGHGRGLRPVWRFHADLRAGDPARDRLGIRPGGPAHPRPTARRPAPSSAPSPASSCSPATVSRSSPSPVSS